MKKTAAVCVKITEEFCLIKDFLFSLIAVHAMAAVSGMNFDSILPWLLLVVLMPCWGKVCEWGKKQLWWGAAGALTYAVLYGTGYAVSEGSSVYALISVMGGFLIGTVIPSGIKSWRNETNVWHKVAGALFMLPIGAALAMEGFLTAAGVYQGFGNVLILLILYSRITNALMYFGRRNLWSVAGAGLFGLFSSIGHFGIFEEFGWFGLILSFICWGILFYAAIEAGSRIIDTSGIITTGRIRKPWIYGIGFFIVTVFVDAFFLLTFFPGVMEYDSYIQMCQVLGDPYSNHHPWLHTMMIKGIYEIGLAVLHSTNRAFALYSFVSICMLAFTFACVLTYLRSKGLKRQYVILLGLLYVMSPINQMYSIIMWKDIPFGVSVVLFIVLICRMRDNLLESRSNLCCFILFIPISFCLCFFRSNGLYVFIGMIPFMIWGFWRQKKAAITAMAVVLILGIIYKGPVFDYFDVKEPDTIESLSIPAQQIAAVVAYGGDMTEKQRLILSNLIELDKVPDAYLGSVTCSDAVKDLVREKGNQEYIVSNAGQLLQMYVQLFGDNKEIYVKAFVDETRGYWYHKTYFPFIWATYIQDNGMGIDRDSKVPENVEQAVRAYLTRYKIHFDQYQSTGLYVYMFFLSLILALKKKSKYLLAYLPCLGIWGTLLIATPVFADLRYAYAIYLAVPLLICLTLYTGHRDYIKDGNIRQL